MLDSEESKIELVLPSSTSTSPTQKELQLKSIEDAQNVLELGKPVDTLSLLRDTDVLMYGDIHIDYAIPDHLLGQIEAFKNAGVTSFGFEINPNPVSQKIFDEINAGNTDRASEIDWSLGGGNDTVRQTKERLVTQLVQSGIRVYPCAPWDSSGGIGEGKEYTREVEQQAAKIISDQTHDGKTVVLLGGRHVEYGDGRKFIPFPHTADSVKALDKKVKSVAFAGGMQIPGAYDRTPEEHLRRAAIKNKIQVAIAIDTRQQKIEGFHNDEVIILPEVPLLLRNQPVPPERMLIGNHTPLENIRPQGAIQNARSVIQRAGK